MSSEIFDQEAVEAALDAYETFPSSKLARMKIAMEIAVASLRERGMMRHAAAVEIGKNDWCAFTNTDGSSEVDMPVVIIRLPKETA
jgi:hypothetical protein